MQLSQFFTTVPLGDEENKAQRNKIRRLKMKQVPNAGPLSTNPSVLDTQHSVHAGYLTQYYLGLGQQSNAEKE